MFNNVLVKLTLTNISLVSICTMALLISQSKLPHKKVIKISYNTSIFQLKSVLIIFKNFSYSITLKFYNYIVSQSSRNISLQDNRSRSLCMCQLVLWSHVSYWLVIGSNKRHSCVRGSSTQIKMMTQCDIARLKYCQKTLVILQRVRNYTDICPRFTIHISVLDLLSTANVRII